jgi:N-acetyl-anhydromuramyl-L-alanine amidase AmpD
MDLLKKIEDNRTLEEDEQKKKQLKEELEQLYGYDAEKEEEDEQSMASKFMATLEKLRQKRAEQMKRMV